MQQAVTEWWALTLSKEVPILTKDTALTLLRFLKVQRWKHINESWLYLMKDWLDSEDNRDDSWKEEEETLVGKRNFNLTQESVRLGTDGPRPPKLRRMNASPNLYECFQEPSQTSRRTPRAMRNCAPFGVLPTSQNCTRS